MGLVSIALGVWMAAEEPVTLEEPLLAQRPQLSGLGAVPSPPVGPAPGVLSSLARKAAWHAELHFTDEEIAFRVVFNLKWDNSVNSCGF